MGARLYYGFTLHHNTVAVETHGTYAVDRISLTTQAVPSPSVLVHALQVPQSRHVETDHVLDACKLVTEAPLDVSQQALTTR